jgi:hypothetical protein
MEFVIVLENQISLKFRYVEYPMESAQNLADSKPDISCQYLKLADISDIINRDCGGM